MAPEVKRHAIGETLAHARLKRLSMIWAQTRGYSACATEVSLPRCRFRADVAAFCESREGNCAAIFECKQTLADLHRDDCDSTVARQRLQVADSRKQIIERNLRIHYPSLRTGDSLFADFDFFNFSALGHRNYNAVTQQSTALRRRLSNCTKFEKLVRYRCANLFYLVIGARLQSQMVELPAGWGLLVERGDILELEQKPIWQQMAAPEQTRFLRRIASAGMRALNRELGITAETIGSSWRSG